MQTKKPSTIKIILLLALLCFIIMGSVLLYHYRHPQKPTPLANDHALVFAVGRDIKPFSLVSLDNVKFSESNLRQHWTLLFFGFTHCMSICPTTLSMLKDAYPTLQQRYPNLQVVFASLDPERDTPSIVTDYTKRFHPDFIGITGSLAQVRKLQVEFGIASNQDESASGNNYQIIHTSSIMLISPQGKWVAMYRNDMTTQDFISVFNQTMKTLT